MVRQEKTKRRAEYKPGDLILVKVFNRRKLDPYFTGPFNNSKTTIKHHNCM